MRLKQTILSMIVVLVALGTVAIAVEKQTLKLALQEKVLLQSVYSTSRTNELKHYVSLAQTAIWKIALHEGNLQHRQKQALEIIYNMKFGDDGYFFVYDQYGNILLDPSQIVVQGVDFCEPTDSSGKDQAELILTTAQAGGGMIQYDWQKPSSQTSTTKIAYVVPVKEWGWTLGAGLYTDDIDQKLLEIDKLVQANIKDTKANIFWIASLSIILITILGAMINISNNRSASLRLRHLSNRLTNSQEDERSKFAKELHDGVIQVIASSKYLLEAAKIKINHDSKNTIDSESIKNPQNLIDQSLNRINDALNEIRRVSHGLKPAALEKMGLSSALMLMVEELKPCCNFCLSYKSSAQVVKMTPAYEIAFFRTAQEALNNIQKHASPSSVIIELEHIQKNIRLTIKDDGKGFDLRAVEASHHGGIGISNMRERIETLGGKFTIKSGTGGTCIEAELPQISEKETAL